MQFITAHTAEAIRFGQPGGLRDGTKSVQWLLNREGLNLVKDREQPAYRAHGSARRAGNNSLVFPKGLTYQRTWPYMRRLRSTTPAWCARRIPGPDAVLQSLAFVGVACAMPYPVPVHLQPADVSLGCGPEVFSVEEKCAWEFLSSPMCPELMADQIRGRNSQVPAEPSFPL
jgi:hypothetical protein